MKQSARPAPRHSAYSPPALTAAQIAHLADRALAGDVVSPGSIEGLGALLDELKRRGYTLKLRTEYEQQAAPWLFIVAPVETSPVPAETFSQEEKS